jgi:hypothetical protein
MEIGKELHEAFMAGVDIDDILARHDPEEVLSRYGIEERLSGLKIEEIEKYLKNLTCRPQK